MRQRDWLGGMCFLVGGVGCILSVRPLSDDFSDLSPDEALDQSLQRLASIYAFTDWKAIDWAETGTQLAEEEDGDRALRRLVLAMPDGHVSLWNDDPALDLCPEARGGLGLTFAILDDGTLIVDALEADGAAAAAGVQVGDTLLSREGLDGAAALAAMPLYCSPVGLATHARRSRMQARLLGRAPVSTTAVLELLPADGPQRAVSLLATDDGATVRAVLDMPQPEARVRHQMWTTDIGYIRVGWEETLLSERLFRQAVTALWADGARSLIVDLRDNDGGTDQTAANIVGVFYDEEAFYETITMYDRRTERQVAVSEVTVEPQPVLWDLPVAVLINSNTVSSGEGMAMMLAPLDAVEVIGFEGTAASFGSAGSEIRLPGGWTLSYPAGRSLDAAGDIQLDSDASLEGGVLPEHRVPWTAENRIAQAADPEGFLVDYAAAWLLEGGR